MARVGLLSDLPRLLSRGKKDRAPFGDRPLPHTPFGPPLPHTEAPFVPRENPEPRRVWIEATPFRCSASGAALGAAESCSVYHSAGSRSGTVVIGALRGSPPNTGAEPRASSWCRALHDCACKKSARRPTRATSRKAGTAAFLN
eukprot:scaffold52626_cov61-Phaeocystis_antarctica.AAC.3